MTPIHFECQNCGINMTCATAITIVVHTLDSTTDSDKKIEDTKSQEEVYHSSPMKRNDIPSLMSQGLYTLAKMRYIVKSTKAEVWHIFGSVRK